MEKHLRKADRSSLEIPRGLDAIRLGAVGFGAAGLD